MTSRDLWTKLIEGGRCRVSGNSIYPEQVLKIGGKVIDHLEKKDDDVSIILKDVIHHPGEDIDYSVYGTPKHAWAA